MPPLILTAPPSGSPAQPNPATLLQQMIEVQREQLAVLRGVLAASDDRGRWRAMYARHADDFPDLPGECKGVLPHVERAYLTAVADLTAELSDPDATANEFSVGELLDKHVPRLGQLWAVLNQVGQLAGTADAK